MKSLCYLLLYISLGKLNALNHKHFKEPTKMSPLYRKALEIIVENYNEYAKTLLVLGQENLEFPMRALRWMPLTGLVINANVKSPIDVALVKIKFRSGRYAETDISKFVSFLTRGQIKVVILLTNTNEARRNEIEVWISTAFKILWNVFVCNVVVVLSSQTQENNDENAEVFVYEPYLTQTLHRITKWPNRKLFHNKVDNLYGHELRVGDHAELVFNSEVLHLSRLLADKFNATVRTIVTRNCTLNDIYRRLANGSLDLMITATFVRSELSRKFDTTYPRKRLDMRFVLPRYGGVEYRGIIGGKVTEIVVATLGTLCLIYVLLTTAKCSLRRVGDARMNAFPFLVMIKTFFSQSDRGTQRTESFTFRILLGCWLAYSTVSSTILQTSMTSRIIRPHVMRPIETLDDLIASHVRIVTQREYLEFILTHAEPKVRGIVEKTAMVTNDDTIFATRNPDIGYLLPDPLAKYARRFSVFQTKHWPYFKVLAESAVPNLQAYYVRKRSPYVRKFDKILERLTEGGIFHHWYSNSDYSALLNVNVTMKCHEVYRAYIKLKHLKSVFCFYAIGLVLSLLLFSCEILFHPRHHANNTTIHRERFSVVTMVIRVIETLLSE